MAKTIHKHKKEEEEREVGGTEEVISLAHDNKKLGNGGVDSDLGQET